MKPSIKLIVHTTDPDGEQHMLEIKLDSFFGAGISQYKDEETIPTWATGRSDLMTRTVAEALVEFREGWGEEAFLEALDLMKYVDHTKGEIVEDRSQTFRYDRLADND